MSPRKSCWNKGRFDRSIFLLVFAGCALALSGCSKDTLSPPDASEAPDSAQEHPDGDASEEPPDASEDPSCLNVDCPDTLTCVAGRCTEAGKSCAVEGAICASDTYCDADIGQCVAYGEGAFDESCFEFAVAGVLAPQVKCAFTQAPNGDPFPNALRVQATPTVARLRPTDGSPSIVVPFTAKSGGSNTDTTQGVIRILKGDDCSLVANIGGEDTDGDGRVDWATSSASVALADLDLDGLIDIVFFSGSGEDTTSREIRAFRTTATGFEHYWTAKTAEGMVFTLTSSGWTGISIYDLDDDGYPEVVAQGNVIDGRTGVLRLARPEGWAVNGTDQPSVMADLDGDGKVELTNAAFIWKFIPRDPSEPSSVDTWEKDATYSNSGSHGSVALADFDLDGMPEIVVTHAGGSSLMKIFRLDGTLYRGMSLNQAYSVAGGGPPTVADFDGDGFPEVGMAARSFYTVFDPDCLTTTDPATGLPYGPRTATSMGGETITGTCIQSATACDDSTSSSTVCPSGILWQRSTQDNSSSVTGSSVFDFEADGSAEVVYADECFVRIYSGKTGEVLFSQFHASATWSENPVVADVDGNLRAELVIPSQGSGVNCDGSLENGVDRQFAGIHCDQDADCVSQSCVDGLCRCTSSADCCGERDATTCETTHGFKCSTPPAWAPGQGNTCRAGRPTAPMGIRVYSDQADRWVRSRTIWSQHAYSVTHIDEAGQVARTSNWSQNWLTDGLNNFRQNVPGTADPHALPDVTSSSLSSTCEEKTLVMSAPVCNRGKEAVAAGLSTHFLLPNGETLCALSTTRALAPGECETLVCRWEEPDEGVTQIEVVPNADGALRECNSDNGKTLVQVHRCGGFL